MTRLPMMAAALLVAGASGLFAQATSTPAKRDSAKAAAKDAVSNNAVTHGRIKELTAGQKIVIDVDDAIDKSFDLADKDLKVTLAKSLKVGDPVKVSERSVGGVTKSVTITKHTGGGVAHGDKDAAAKKP